MNLSGAIASLGAATLTYTFGNPGDRPFVGDFNGDGTDTVGLHRESKGFVYFRDAPARASRTRASSMATG